MTITYDQLRPLILRETIEGRTVAVVFSDPETGTRVASQATMIDDIGMGATIASQAAVQAQWALRRELSQSIGRALGYGLFGQVTRDAVDRAVSPVAAAVRRDRVFDEDDRQAAIVRAFQAVQHHFRWDGGRWVGVTQVSARPTAQLTTSASPPRPATSAPPAWSAPAATPPPAPVAADRTVFLRMLVEVAGADGEVHADEAALFASVDPSADLAALRAMPPLSAADLAAVPIEVRERWLETAAAMALTDERITQTEGGRLAAWRDAWQISRTRYAEIERAAREHLVRLAAASLSPAEREGPLPRPIQGLAARLGIPPQRAAQLIRG